MKDKNKKKAENESGYMTMGMCLGMIFGAALGLVLFHNLGVGVSTGMCVGMCIGLLADAGKKKAQSKEAGMDEATQTQQNEKKGGKNL